MEGPINYKCRAVVGLLVPTVSLVSKLYSWIIHCLSISVDEENAVSIRNLDFEAVQCMSNGRIMVIFAIVKTCLKSVLSIISVDLI